MGKILLSLMLAFGSAQAQIVVEERQIVVPQNQNFMLYCPAKNCRCSYHSTWAAKRYGPQYECVEDVPFDVRQRVDNPPQRVISVPVYRVIPTHNQSLPGQTEEQRRILN
jgi:hypothetical protein